MPSIRQILWDPPRPPLGCSASAAGFVLDLRSPPHPPRQLPPGSTRGGVDLPDSPACRDQRGTCGPKGSGGHPSPTCRHRRRALGAPAPGDSKDAPLLSGAPLCTRCCQGHIAVIGRPPLHLGPAKDVLSPSGAPPMLGAGKDVLPLSEGCPCSWAC